VRPRIEFIGAARDRLGESPLWDPETGWLYWVDSVAPSVHRFDPATGRSEARSTSDLIGSIGLRRPNLLIMALRDGFYGLDFATGSETPLHRLGLPADQRLNDGKMDRQGRFLCGAMHRDGFDAPSAKLYRLHGDLRCDELESGILISNALCFSPAGDTLYFADSPRGLLWAYPYDPVTGAVGPRRVLANLVALTGSSPDGATVDAEGCIWIALVRTGQIGRLRPSGTLDYVFDVPVPHPTCPAFGGPGLRTLFVTSISDSGRLKSDHPDAGRLLAIEGLGVQGLPEARFAEVP